MWFWWRSRKCKRLKEKQTDWKTDAGQKVIRITHLSFQLKSLLWYLALDLVIQKHKKISLKVHCSSLSQGLYFWRHTVTELRFKCFVKLFVSRNLVEYHFTSVVKLSDLWPADKIISKFIFPQFGLYTSYASCCVS